MEYHGIDISQHNGSLNWEKIKGDGIQFAIIRTGFGKAGPKQIDKKYEENYLKAKSVGMYLGAYHYSYALTVEDAKAEADFVLSLLKAKRFEFPIFIDIEEKSQQKLSKEQCTAIVTTFCQKLEEAGYWAGVYSYDSFFATNLDSSIQDRYSIWSSRVENIRPQICKNFDMWQYSLKGTVNGSSKVTDMNICYKDFPSIIRQSGKNGFPPVMTPSTNNAKKQTYFVKFNNIATKGEAKTIAQKIGSLGYTDNIIGEE